MRRLTAFCLLLYSVVAAVAGVQAGETLPTEVKDPFYGQVLFDFHQQNYFSAITHLRAAQQQGRLPHHGVEAELLLGGLYLAYGMQKNAEVIFNQLLQQSVNPEQRNRLWLALAKINYQRGYEAKATELLQRVNAPLPPPQENERQLLTSTLLAQRGLYAEAAAQLASYQPDSVDSDFAQYNLALDHIRQGRDAAGRLLLEALLQRGGSAEPARAELYDKSRIALGYSYLQHQKFAPARHWFEQVRLRSPFASQALLGLGWVESGLGNGAAALAIWLPLIERNGSDPAVLEALLAVPYTLNQLGAQQQALDHYKQAIELYASELLTLQGITSGMNFVALAQELADPRSAAEAGWQWRTEITPGSVLSPYLYRVMAGREFQEALRNYRDLLYLETNLTQWLADLDAYEAMVDVREAGYQTRLPLILNTLAKLDSNTLQQQRDKSALQLHEIEAANDATGLATADEQQLLASLAQIEARMQRLEAGVDVEKQQRKFAVLKGLALWRLETEYPTRLWQTKQQLQQLDETLKLSTEQQRSLNTVLERSPNDFKHYRQRLQNRRQQTVLLQQQTERLARQSEAHLQQLAQAAVVGIKARIEDYQGQAQFAVAQIYDALLPAQKEQP